MLMRPSAMTLALIESERLLDRGQWVRVETRDDGKVVFLEWGTIHTNGERERAIADRTYTQLEHRVEVGPVMAHA